MMKPGSHILLFLISTFLFTGCGSDLFDKPVRFEPGQVPFQQLSEYHFFTGNMADLNPNDRVIPYDINSPLFSDYAEKVRFIWIPEGATGIYNDSTFFDLPVGTVLIKNFYYPDDFRVDSGPVRIIETRLLVHNENGWRGLPYIWNEAQTEAHLQLAGGEANIEFINKNGQPVQVNYLIPNTNQCQSCHFHYDKQVPIGPAARHLNKSFLYEDGRQNQLVKWAEAGYLEGIPDPVHAPKMADYRNYESESIDNRARAYLDINCGHCHNPGGAANTSGLFLHVDEDNPTALGIMKPPVAAGKGSGGKSFSIVPGNPDDSILLYRMESTEPGILMPELGRTLVDEEGAALIREWIESLQMN
jgi:uncharacterized repeat protein (TIGR03806 family)